MTKLRMVLAAVVIGLGCTPPPAPGPTAAEKAAAPKGACFCKSNACICSHCSLAKGECNCKR